MVHTERWMFSFRYRAYFRTYKTLGRADKLNTAIFETRVDVHLCSNAVCVIVNWTPHISNAKKGELYIKSKYYMNTFIVRKKGYRSNRSGCFRTQLHVKLTRCYICQTVKRIVSYKGYEINYVEKTLAWEFLIDLLHC